MSALARAKPGGREGRARGKAANVKGILGRLFGGGSGGEATPGEAVDYKGFRIRAAPYAAEGQYQTAGIIEKDFSDGMKEHRFIRAERHATRDDAAAFAITKGQQIVDERGDKIFDEK
jgi:hypothetical protein